jgi:hypothetical protein
MSGTMDIRQVVLDLLMKLETEGVLGYRVWFANKPHIIVSDTIDGWDVVFKRGGVTVKMTLDKNYNVVYIKVEA